MKTRRREKKEKIIGAKMGITLSSLLEADADREGTSVSHILRRIVIQHYAERDKPKLQAVPSL